MKVSCKFLYAVGGGIAAAIAAYLCFRSSPADAAEPGPVVPGQITSGQRSLVIDTNVNSPTFGQVIQ